MDNVLSMTGLKAQLEDLTVKTAATKKLLVALSDYAVAFGYDVEDIKVVVDENND